MTTEMVLSPVLLVEDEPSIRRFAAMALDDLPIHLAEADGLVAARKALQQPRTPPFCLVLCDLMLVDGSGIDLLRELSDTPALRRGAKLVVLSAGLDSVARTRLEGIDLFKVLSKPVSVTDLRNCVIDALPGIGNCRASAQNAFGANASLFAAFEASCIEQFAVDVDDGDLALDRDDLNRLHRLAHSLKSVLASLGQREAALKALALELAVLTNLGGVRSAWADLRQALLAIREKAAASSH